MDFSNKTLVVMAFLILSFSIFGSIYSLNLLDRVSITGQASTTGVGDVNLSIASTVSIALNDSGINFGSCAVLGAWGLFDSFLDNSTGNVNNANCTGGTFPDNITINNDGNVNVKVNASISMLPSSLYGAGSSLSLKMDNYSAAPGCNDDLTTYATNFSGTGSAEAIDLCTNLTYTNGGDSMEVYAFYWLPSTATSTGGNSIDVTFTAELAT